MKKETMVEILSHNHASELISLSGTYLEQNESENNLPIGLAYRLAEDPYYYTSELPLHQDRLCAYRRCVGTQFSGFRNADRHRLIGC